MQSCSLFQNVMLYICYNVDAASDEVLISANSNYTRGVISVQLAVQPVLVVVSRGRPAFVSAG